MGTSSQTCSESAKNEVFGIQLTKVGGYHLTGTWLPLCFRHANMVAGISSAILLCSLGQRVYCVLLKAVMLFAFGETLLDYTAL